MKCSRYFGSKPCDRDAQARGMCGTHYMRWLQKIELDAPLRRNGGGPCVAYFGTEPCPRKAAGNGHELCHTHNMRRRRGCDLNAPLQHKYKEDGPICKGWFGDVKCTNPVKAHGDCATHCERHRRGCIDINAPKFTRPKWATGDSRRRAS